MQPRRCRFVRLLLFLDCHVQKPDVFLICWHIFLREPKEHW
ncbi:hypothetical protein J2W40_002637 [Sphingobium xenophagum]|uniref:Uncharacterized protein n=1 Tax=Sphingobium xenophagum TaxID=121428 RepID=A0ABU1X2L5_SPHXE|nr:hypothetical protein [Sphingobium xenophagum]